MQESDNPVQGYKRVIYILAPAIILILCLGAINLASFMSNKSSERTPSAASTVGPDALIAGGDMMTAVPPTPLSTRPTSQPTPAPTPYPTLPPNATIELLGPPEGSFFGFEDSVTFYWRWGEPLLEGQQLAVYTRVDGQEKLLGTLNEPNVGQDYRWQVKIEALTDTAVSAEWLIRLELEEPSSLLLESERRTMTILP